MKKKFSFIIFSFLFIFISKATIAYSIEKIESKINKAWNLGDDETFKQVENEIIT
jgi:hypothetical protein